MTTVPLAGLLTMWWAVRSRSRTERTEPARLAMRAAWSIAPGHPGEPPSDAAYLATVLAAAAATHCAPTVLTADIDDENVWRGAYLG